MFEDVCSNGFEWCFFVFVVLLFQEVDGERFVKIEVGGVEGIMLVVYLVCKVIIMILFNVFCDLIFILLLFVCCCEVIEMGYVNYMIKVYVDVFDVVFEWWNGC